MSNSEIDAVLNGRKSTYGEYGEVSSLSQQLQQLLGVHKRVLYSHAQREALQMIASKLSRIVNGDPNHRDSWIDIAGYAKLAADSIPEED